MKIEKRKVSQNKVLSLAAKSAIAAALGMSASLALSACDDSSSAKDDEEATPGPLGGDVAPEEQDIIRSSSSESTPEPSSQEQAPASSSQVDNSSPAETAPSSSSNSIDIPLSHEPVSSSVQEALSSLVESSCSEAAPASSETAPESSSNVAPSSSSHHGWGDTDPSSSSNRYSEECPDNDPWCIQVRMCEDQPGGCMVASMVTTFECDDVTG